jgi:hypothetical protein
MNSLAKDNNPKFTRMIIRDFLVLAVVSFICAAGIVLTLYFSIKYNW